MATPSTILATCPRCGRTYRDLTEQEEARFPYYCPSPACPGRNARLVGEMVSASLRAQRAAQRGGREAVGQAAPRFEAIPEPLDPDFTDLDMGA